MYYEKHHWVNDINTNQQPMWSSTVRSRVIGTILSVSLLDYEKQQDTGTGNLENFLLGKKLLDENENQKMKYKIQIQVTYKQ